MGFPRARARITLAKGGERKTQARRCWRASLLLVLKKISRVPYRDGLQPPTERKFWHGPEVATSLSAERNGFDELRSLS